MIHYRCHHSLHDHTDSGLQLRDAVAAGDDGDRVHHHRDSDQPVYNVLPALAACYVLLINFQHVKHVLYYQRSAEK